MLLIYVSSHTNLGKMQSAPAPSHLHFVHTEQVHPFLSVIFTPISINILYLLPDIDASHPICSIYCLCVHLLLNMYWGDRVVSVPLPIHILLYNFHFNFSPYLSFQNQILAQNSHLLREDSYRAMSIDLYNPRIFKISGMYCFLVQLSSNQCISAAFPNFI